MFIPWDTETTGKVDFKRQSTVPWQPHLCSIAWITASDAGENEGEQLHHIKPDGWIVPPEAVAIHGLTTEFLTENGKPLADVIEMFFTDIERAAYRVAYNHGFDNKMIRIEQHRLGHGPDRLEWWKNGPSKCAMRPMQSRMAKPTAADLKARGWTKYKTPELAESHTHLFGVPHDDQHGALGDARAALAIWQRLLSDGTLSQL